MEDDAKSFAEAADAAADSLSAALRNLGSGEPPAPKIADPETADDDVDKPTTSEDAGDDPAEAEDDAESDEEDVDVDVDALKTQLEEQRAEIERLKAAKSEPARPAASDDKAPTPTATKEAPEDPTKDIEAYDAWMARIAQAKEPTADEARVLSGLNSLKAEDAKFKALEKEARDAGEKEAKIGSDIKNLQLLLARAEDELKEDDLDAGNQRRVERYRTELKEKRDELRDHQVASTRLETRVEREKARLEAEIVRFDAAARNFHGEIHASQTRQTRTKDLQGVWHKGLTDVIASQNNAMAGRKERKFDADETASITEHFASLLNVHIREHKAAPEDLAKWIAEQKAPFERATRIRKSSGASTAKRAADLEPRRPTDAKTPRSATRGKERARTFEDEYEASGERLERLLRAG